MDQNEQPITPTWQRATERAHDPRHFAATTMRKAGVDVKTVSERLGHSSVRITGDL